MKVARRTAQAIASIAILSLLFSGSVFAYSTRLSHISSLAAPSPLADDTSSKTATSTSNSDSSKTSTESADQQTLNQVNQNTKTGQEQGEYTLKYNLVPVTGAAGKGVAEVQIAGTDVRVDLQIEQAAKSTTYTAVLSTSASDSCASKSIGSLVTSDNGQAEVELPTTLAAGTYSLGLILCINGQSALTSDANQPATISTATTTADETMTESSTATEDETGQANQDETSTVANQANQVNAQQEGKQEQDEIKSAEDSKQIPAIVDVSAAGSSITQLDPKFSVSVTNPTSNSYDVSISGSNVVGPRVLLINLANNAGAVASGSLKVTYDGAAISEASSLSQLFSGTSTSPPSYIILLTSSGAQLLVFVPHFSTHLIELVALPSTFGAFSAEAPLLLAGLVAVAAASAVVYARRKRFTPTVAL